MLDFGRQDVTEGMACKGSAWRAQEPDWPETLEKGITVRKGEQPGGCRHCSHISSDLTSSSEKVPDSQQQHLIFVACRKP